jgi:DNA-binding winged helix-turn-helix (wHTH) protein
MRYDFGRCHLDTESREVGLDGAPMHLSPKAFSLLRLLIEDRPRVVPKAELMQRLWPDSFVEEANLPVLVAEARAAIGDAGVGHIIRTHHRVGYGFVADVRETHSSRARAQTGPQWVLVLPDGRRLALGTGNSIVGRDGDADVQIPDASVSRRHARIVVDGDAATVEDLNSKNGTRVGGVRVSQPIRLAKGDIVAFGSVETRLQAGPVDETATASL